jgi:hypothetical protein
MAVRKQAFIPGQIEGGPTRAAILRRLGYRTPKEFAAQGAWVMLTPHISARTEPCQNRTEASQTEAIVLCDANNRPSLTLVLISMILMARL